MAFLTSGRAFPPDPREDPALTEEEERGRLLDQAWTAGALYAYASELCEEFWQELEHSASDADVCLIKAQQLQ